MKENKGEMGVNRQKKTKGGGKRRREEGEKKNKAEKEEMKEHIWKDRYKRQKIKNGREEKGDRRKKKMNVIRQTEAK